MSQNNKHGGAPKNLMWGALKHLRGALKHLMGASEHRSMGSFEAPSIGSPESPNRVLHLGQREGPYKVIQSTICS